MIYMRMRLRFVWLVHNLAIKAGGHGQSITHAFLVLLDFKIHYICCHLRE